MGQTNSFKRENILLPIIGSRIASIYPKNPFGLLWKYVNLSHYAINNVALKQINTPKKYLKSVYNHKSNNNWSSADGCKCISCIYRFGVKPLGYSSSRSQITIYYVQVEVCICIFIWNTTKYRSPLILLVV